MAEQFNYKDKKWLKKRAAILRRDGYLCQECKKYGRRREAVTVHHIKHAEIHPELAYADSNLVSLCNACHNKMHPEKGGRRNVSSCMHWLTGLIKCGYCGSAMTYNGINHCPGFQCWKYSKGQHKESTYISEKKLLAAIYEHFEMILDGADFEYVYHAPEDTKLNKERNSILEELNKISSREARIALAFEKGIDTLEEYAENKKRLKMAREDLEKQLEVLNNTPASNGPSKDEILNTVRQVYEIIKNPDIEMELKGNVMRSIVSEIVYDKEKQELIFRFDFS